MLDYFNGIVKNVEVYDDILLLVVDLFNEMVETIIYVLVVNFV